MSSSVNDLTVCRWQDAKPRLRKALGDYLLGAQRAVKNGEACPYRIKDTYLLLRGEQFDNGARELVVVGLDGDMAIGTRAAVNHALNHGFQSIRAHFSKRGALRFIQRLGFPAQLIEIRDGREFVIQIRFENMGGKSSSRSSSNTVTTTTNVSGSAAAQGDNYGVMLSGVNSSDINLTMTDHGALEVAKEFGDTALNLAGSALKNNASVSTHAIDALTNAAGQQAQTTKAAIAMANAAKTREQTGATESNNKTLTTMSLVIGIVATLITIYFMMKKGAKA